MKKQTKQFIFWTVIASLIIIAVIVVKNLDAFMNGLRLGGAIE